MRALRKEKDFNFLKRGSNRYRIGNSYGKPFGLRVIL